jgi:hypothetical protein
VRILECIVSHCKSLADGGGIYLTTSGQPYSSSVLRATLVTNCTAANGGGVQIAGLSLAVVSHCTITLNQATTRGGGLRSNTNWQLGLRLDNTRILNNTASEGGGLFIQGSGPFAFLTNVTVANNQGSTSGGGLRVWGQASVPSSVKLVNSILWDNTAPGGPQVEIGSSHPLGVVTVNAEYCDVEGGQAQVAVGPNASLSWGAGNIDMDPLFANAHLKLGPASPCIDAGDATAVAADWGDIDGDGNITEPVPLDLALLPRVVDVPGIPDTGKGPPPIVDMGAYERQP